MSIDKKNLVIWAFVLIVLVAVVLRFYNLPIRPIHHDEASGHHTFKNDVLVHKKYIYDPVYHGPFLYHIGAVFYKYFGISEVTNRAPTALFGVLLVVLAWFLRYWVGDIGMLVTAAILAVSPAQVYFSRFALHDSFFDFFTLAVVLSLLWYVKSPDWKRAALLGLSVGFLWTVKENVYFIAGILGLYAVLELVFFSKSRGIVSKIKDAIKNVWENRVHLYAGIAAFAIPFTVIYSSYFRHPKNIVLAVTLPLTKWFELATTWEGHFKPASYYIHLLAKYEFAAVILGVIGLYICLRRFKVAPHYRFMALWVVLNTALYFINKYKTPWLVTHLIFPLAVAAGFGIHVALQTQKWWRRDLIIAAFLLILATVPMSIHASFYNYDDTTNKDFAYVQTGRGIFDLMSHLERNGERSIRVIAKEYAWPLFWYMRERGFHAGHEGEIPSENITNPVVVTSYELNVTGYRTSEYSLGHHGRYFVHIREG